MRTEVLIRTDGRMRNSSRSNLKLKVFFFYYVGLTECYRRTELVVTEQFLLGLL